MISRWTIAPTLRRANPLALSAQRATYRTDPTGPRNTRRRPVQPLRPIRPSRNEPPQLESTEATPSEQNTLLAPVHIPEDPNGVLNERHPAASILGQSGLVVQRQLEMMNVMLGWEQANRYTIHDANGSHVGYIAEQDGMGRTMSRQFFKTHRAFTTHIFDRNEREVLRFNRPFSWINSRIRVYDPLNPASQTQPITQTSQSLALMEGSGAHVSPLDISQMRIIGEAQQFWAPLRRKYNLFLFREPPNNETNLEVQQLDIKSSDLSPSQQLQVSQHSGGDYYQFAYVDEPFLSWDFSLRSADSRLIGSVNRNFAGFGREIFTDTGVYALRMDSAGLTEEAQNRHLISQSGQQALMAYDNKTTGMTLDQRAVMLATAVSIDFDYFSRHSSAGSGMGFMPIWIPGVGGEAAAGGVAAGEAGAVGAVGEGAAGAAGTAARGVGMGEGVAAAGGLAGYEAMQRGLSGQDYNQGQGNEATVQTQDDPLGADSNSVSDDQTTDSWLQDPWENPPPGSGGDGNGGAGDGGGDGDWGDWF